MAALSIAADHPESIHSFKRVAGKSNQLSRFWTLNESAKDTFLHSGFVRLLAVASSLSTVSALAASECRNPTLLLYIPRLLRSVIIIIIFETEGIEEVKPFT